MAVGNLSEEEVQKLLRRIMESSRQTSRGHQMPTGLLERLGIGANLPEGRRAKNLEEGNFGQQQHQLDIDEGQSAKITTKRASFLKEKARALASKAEFYEASKLLEDYADEGGVADLGANFLMTECYLQLGRENRANKCLRRIENLLKSEPLLPASDLIEMANDLLVDSAYVRAMVILNIAVDIVVNSSATPDEILSGVYQCCDKLDDVLREMLGKRGRSHTIAADMGMEMLVDMFEKLGAIKNCNRTTQVIKESQCCRSLGHKYSMLRDVKNSFKYAKIAVTKMEEHFTPTAARRHHIYGGQLHNLAIALGNLQRFEEAAAVYEKAIEAKENAVDYPADLVRKSDIDKAKRDLKQLRSVMG